jgi:UDP-N-acetylglucosamine 2-epimerase (hydrolysing)
MGENKNSVFVVGSPDYDLMKEKFLPSISQLKKRYKIEFNSFAISIIHPSTKYKKNKINAKTYFDSLLASKENFIIIYPNNDPGNEIIVKEIKRIVKTDNRFKVFPSMRFEYFLRALKISNFIIGNSSAGIREAPFFSVPTINVGDRQLNRANLKSISNVNFDKKQIVNKIKNISVIKKRNFYFGKGDSADNIYKIVRNKNFWKTSMQKKFFTY